MFQMEINKSLCLLILFNLIIAFDVNTYSFDERSNQKLPTSNVQATFSKFESPSPTPLLDVTTLKSKEIILQVSPPLNSNKNFFERYQQIVSTIIQVVLGLGIISIIVAAINHYFQKAQKDRIHYQETHRIMLETLHEYVEKYYMPQIRYSDYLANFYSEQKDLQDHHKRNQSLYFLMLFNRIQIIQRDNIGGIFLQDLVGEILLSKLSERISLATGTRPMSESKAFPSFEVYSDVIRGIKAELKYSEFLDLLETNKYKSVLGHYKNWVLYTTELEELSKYFRLYSNIFYCEVNRPYIPWYGENIRLKDESEINLLKEILIEAIDEENFKIEESRIEKYISEIT